MKHWNKLSSVWNLYYPSVRTNKSNTWWERLGYSYYCLRTEWWTRSPHEISFNSVLLCQGLTFVFLESMCYRWMIYCMQTEEKGTVYLDYECWYPQLRPPESWIYYKNLHLSKIYSKYVLKRYLRLVQFCDCKQVLKLYENIKCNMIYEIVPA